MNRSNGGILAAIVVFALFFASGGRMGQSAPQDTATSEQTPRRTAAAPAPASATETADGFSYQLRRLANELRDETNPVVHAEMSREITAVLKGVNLGSTEVIVATVPHPTRTHLALFADRMIEAIQQAVQSGGYRFDRALMPWESRDISELDDLNKQWAQEDLVAGMYRVPGIMIFRGNTTRHAHVVVLLVGEKPTGGIDRLQFEAAVDIARELGSKQQLLILGPTFSGSLPSLARLLAATSSDFARVTVASGTVTGPVAIAAFQEELRNQERTPATSAAPAKFGFATFQYDDGYAMAALRTFAKKYWRYVKPGDVTLVSESETEYGSHEKTIEKTLEKTPEKTPEKKSDPLYFPRGISHLRTAYEQQQKVQAATDPTLRLPSAVLRGPLGEMRRGGDSVPTYASQSAISQDAVLGGIVQELEFRGTRLVLVLATDPLDSLFLVRYIRGHYPRARVVMMTADSLLRHEGDDPLLRGVLELTTYSLRAATEEYLRDRREDSGSGQVFAGSDAKGAYNAAVTLVSCIEDPASPWCTHKPEAQLSGDSLFEYGPSWFAPREARAGVPDLKLDVLGTDDFYPVASICPEGSPDGGVGLNCNDKPQAMAERDSADNKPSTAFEPPLWTPLVTVLVVIGFAALIVLVALLWKRSVVFSGSDTPNALAPVPRGPRRHVLVAAVCAMVYLLALLPLWPLLHAKLHLQTFVLGVWLLFGVAGVILLWKQYSRLAGWALTCMLVPMMVGVLLLRVFIPDSSGLRAFNYRWWHADSGVSPLIPGAFLVMALLWTLWYRLSGTTLVETQLPELPDIDDGNHPGVATLPDTMIAISQRSQQRLRRFMLPLMEWRHLTLPLAVAFFFIAAMCGWQRLFTTLEPAQFDYVLTGIVTVVLWLLVGETIRMLLVWSEMKKLLRALAIQPFSDGFTKVCFSWRQLTKLTVQQMKALRADPWLYKDRPQLRGTANRVLDAYVSLMRKHLSLPAATGGAPATTLSVTGGSPGTAVQMQPEPESRLTGEDALLASFAELKRQLASTAASVCRELSQSFPTEEPPAEKTQKERCRELAVAEISSEHKLEFVLKDVPMTTRDRCVHFVCLLYTNYIVAVLLRIRTMAVSAVGVFVLFVLAMMSYPFEPRGLIRSVLLVIFAALMFSIAFVYAQMHRDETLSRIANTPSGQLGGTFWLRMVGFVGLPLISMLAVQFPSISKFLFSWVEPAMRSVR